MSSLDVVTALLTRRRLIIGLGLLLAALTGIVTLLLPRTFTSRARFLPTSSGASSSLTGLAAQLGFAVPGAQATQGPDFYAALLREEGILADAVETRYPVTGAGGGNLIELFEIESDSPAVARHGAVDALRDAMHVRVLVEIGAVEFSVTTRWPEVSGAVAQRLVELLGRFNVVTRQSQAAAEREFIGGRLTEARAELQTAEQSMRRFLERNRTFERSPQLVMEHDGLQREVIRREAIVGTLGQAFEQARIEEVRNTPVLTMVAAPMAPVEPDRRKLVLRTSAAFMLGALIGLFWTLAGELLRYLASSEPDRFAALRRAAAETLADVRRVARLRSRGPGTGS